MVKMIHIKITSVIIVAYSISITLLSTPNIGRSGG